MSVTTTKNRELSPQEQLRGQLASMGGELRNALPSHIKPEKFQRVVMTVVQQQPDLLQADRKSLLGSCMKCAADGLIPDGREAALVIFNTKIKEKFTRADNSDGEREVWVKAVQYMPMLAGIQKRVRNSGEIAAIEAHVIYEHDEFVWRQGLDGTIIHNPKFPGPRGAPIGAYAVARFKDGSLPQYEVMDFDEIERVRSVSKAKDSGPWKQWWAEMARKTVFRRLSKWLPMDAEADTLLSRDEEAETIEAVAEPVSNIPELPPSKLDALEASLGLEEDGKTYAGEIIEPGTNPEPTLISQVEACETIETLNSLIVSKSFAEAKKKLTAEDAAEVETAIKARRHGIQAAA